MSDARVIVVGGGLAGIAAALDCAGAGADVTLLESRGRLGGAAYSFRRDGLWADNGQHVFLRCCTEYQRLLADLDASELVTIQPRLDIAVLAPAGRRGRLNRSSLPAPLHLASALARYPYLSVAQRLAVTAAMTALRFVDPDDPANDRRSFGAWLRQHGQDARTVQAIWDLIVRPTLNLTSDHASLAQAALVFRLGLLEHTDAGDIGHAVVPLSQIHDGAGRAALARAGVDVRLRAAAASIEPERGGGFEIRLAGGDQLRAHHVIVAVPPARATGLVPDGAGVDRDAWRRLGSSPIVNLHVVYDRPVLDLPFAAGIDSPVQWVFDRTGSTGLTGGGQYLVVTLSAADDELGVPGEQLRERYLPALAELLPAARDATVRTFFVTRDHAATFRAQPGQRALRPGPETALPGLLLAGAWTDTGWPATMEGAVRSGHAAAERVVARLRARSAPTSPDVLRAPDRPRALTVLTPMAFEARALRRGAPGLDVRSTGIGARRAAEYARTHDHGDAAAVVIAGFCGGLAPDLEPGDIVLASELRDGDGSDRTVACADSTILAAMLRRAGLRVHVAPVASHRTLTTGARRRQLAQTGAAAVDLESAWLAPVARDRPLYALRVVLDTPHRELHRPIASATGTAAAYRSLRRAAAVLAQWAPLLCERELMLASPRASCAGVQRAVEIVERALERYGAPVYVRRQIVHNEHVVDALRRRGAVFVQEVQEVPEGATVVFSAHGVSPEVRRAADARNLNVIDATCPLVAKVHAEARRFAASGFDIVLVGHEGHEEIEGTVGEAPEHTTVIASPEDVAGLEVSDPEHVAYLTQTTLAVDETASVVNALRERFPTAVGPPSEDICYATQNRQTAVRSLAHRCDVILVVGSTNSSNSRRLVEVAHRAGCRSLLVENASQLPADALQDARRIGITAGASAPETLVAEVIDAIAGLGAATVSEQSVAEENMHFKLPPEVRQRSN
ncbi:MAG TPA: 4-hydroxy-3-methylbut-2-enyl diphosphate reductase [Solirubrobacteraceae bacterium]|nr:4-hydroxy-3-methylbut-2-enyl diphosphate reductase [Solirubrobacteraceae bacterium]